MLAFGAKTGENSWVAPRFRAVTRDQQFLLPPDVREWLPVGHPALFVVDLVDELDLSGFVAGYRSSDERGRPAYHPSVMVGIVLYASMCSIRSSRRIEALLATDAGFRVVAANERPDHVTICRFIARHEQALNDLFDQVVGMAAEAGLVDPTLVAVDGTKMAADASRDSNETLGDLRGRFSKWAEEVLANDAADDAEEAENPTAGPVPEMADHDQRREWIRRRLAERADESDDRKMNTVDPDSGLVPRSGGGWIQGYNAQAAAVAGGIVVAADVTANPADNTVLDAMVALIDDKVAAATGEHTGVVVADAGYWDTKLIETIDADPDRADLLVAPGRRTPTKAPDPITEPDPALHQTAVAAHEEALDAQQHRRLQIIEQVSAGTMLIREGAEDLGLSVARVGELKLAYEAGGPDALRPHHLPGQHRPKPPRGPTRAGRARHTMNTRLASPAGRSLYRQRQAIIEPVFGDIKTNRRTTRFLRRGLDAVRTEWLTILTGHNLTLLHAHRA